MEEFPSIDPKAFLSNLKEKETQHTRLSLQGGQAPHTVWRWMIWLPQGMKRHSHRLNTSLKIFSKDLFQRSCLFAKFMQKKKSTMLNILLNNNENIYQAIFFNLGLSSISKGKEIRHVIEVLCWILNSNHLLQIIWCLGWKNYYSGKIN